MHQITFMRQHKEHGKVLETIFRQLITHTLTHTKE